MPRPIHIPVSRRRLRALLVGGVLVAVSLVTVWSAWAALAARGELLAARDGLRRVAEAGDLADAPDAVARAREQAASAAARLSAPGPALVAAVPVLGRSLAAERAVAQATADVLIVSERLLPLVDRAGGSSGGAVSLPGLQELADELDRSSRQLERPVAALVDADVSLTPAPVADAVREAQDTLAGADVTLARAAAGVRAAAGLLGGAGPRTLVLGVMNNAELRGAGGYVSSFAVVRTDAGIVSVEPFTDVNAVQAPPARAVQVPSSPTYAASYGRYLADTTLWKNVMMSPHVPDSARVMCEVARLSPGVPCDGALLVDIPALADIMSLAGPVQIGDDVVVGDDLVEALLVEAYSDAGGLGDAQIARRTSLLASADQALVRLLSQPFSGLHPARLLAETSGGRHLAVWSARPDEQQALLEAGVAGSADPAGADLSLFAVNQLSNSKLDYYARRSVDVQVEVSLTTAQVEQRFRVELRVPDDLPAYVVGPRGRLEELLEMRVSPAARDVTLRKDGVVQSFDTQTDANGATRITDLLVLPQGGSVEYTLRYTVPLPEGRYRLQLLPQPLARDAWLSAQVRPAAGLTLGGRGVHVEEPFSASRSFEVTAREMRWWERPLSLPW